MATTKNDAVENARNDLAKRLKIDAADVKEHSVEDADFPDMALGAAEDGEMSGQMITRGWRIKLEAQDQNYEYRADKNQVRAFNFKGKNYRI
jgi:plasmid stability protein